MKQYFLPFALLALGLTACSQSDLQLETPETPVTEISKESVEPGSTKVSLNLAEKVALSTRPGTRAGTDIQDIRTVFTDDGEPAFYAVNFTNSNGFVLVSASQNYTPVLAEVESGSFDLINIPPNMKYYLEGYKYAIKTCNEAPEDSVKNYRRQWKQYLNDETTVQKPVTRSSDPMLDAFIFDSQRQWNNSGWQYTSLSYNGLGLDFFDDVVIDLTDSNPDIDLETCFIVLKPVPILESVEKLLTTEWGQGVPYNALIPNQVVAGCYTVAIAQVMKYHKKPTYYNWDEMKNTYYFYENGSEIARLYADIYDRAKLVYEEGKGSGTNIGNACQALKGYGYSSATALNFETYTVCQNIRDHKPVICGGVSSPEASEGHVYVIDGLHKVWNNCMYFLFVPREAPNATGYFKYIWEKTDLEKGIIETYTTENKFHINWGYNGSYNGLFESMEYKDENDSVYNYDYNKHIIANIN